MSAAASEVRQQSPTRVDLAGGTLDCWPLYLFLDNPITINVAIDIFTGAELKSLPQNQLRLATRDLKVVRDFESWPAALASTEPELAFHRCILQYFFDEHRERVQDRGLSLETWSQSPVGGGLGGSSALTISVLKALSSWLELKWSVSDLVRLASHLEARMLLKPTGTQDYFPPLDGGLCVITYGAEGPRHVRHRFEPKFFGGRFALVYTGRSHHSGINIWQVIKDWLDGDRRTREAMAGWSRLNAEAGMRRLVTTTGRGTPSSRTL
jgi:D-glycero-alpha-D-manno-heptose-7-phosphate kinase